MVEKGQKCMQKSQIKNGFPNNQQISISQINKFTKPMMPHPFNDVFNS